MTSFGTRQRITNHLKATGIYEKVDEFLIDEIMFDMEVLEQCKRDMRDEKGKLVLLSNITRDPGKDPFFQKNRLLDIYNTAQKNIKDSLVKLGITPQERSKLKLAIQDAVDEFGDDFD